MSFEQFVRDSLGDAGGNPVKLNGINIDVGKIGGGVGQLGGDVGKVLGFFGIGGGGGVDFQKLLEDFFKKNAKLFADLLEEFLQKIPDNAKKELARLFSRVVKILSELGDQFLQEFTKALADLLQGIMKVLNTVNGILDSLLDVFFKFFETFYGDLENLLPTSITKGPKDALNGLSELGTFLTALNRNGRDRLQEITHRIDLVANSITKLISELTDTQLFLGDIVTAPTSAITSVLSGNTPQKAFADFVKTAIKAPQIFDVAKDAFTFKNILNWVSLPHGVPVGKLNKWLNDKATYLNPAAPEAIERQYRARLVAEVDNYMRRSLNSKTSQQGLTRVDERISTGILVDLITVFLDTTIVFALEPQCYPLVDVDWENFEDIGHKPGAFSAKQIRAAIRATVGSVLRGIWVWGVKNDNLIEAIPTLIGSIFTPILEGIFRQLVFTLEVVSVYPQGKYPAAQLPAGFEFHRWSSLETVENSGNDADRLEYVAYVRHFRPQVALDPAQVAALRANNFAWIKGLLEDVGAYIDVAYQRFKVDTIFPDLKLNAPAGFEPYDVLAPVAEPFIDPISKNLIVRVTSDAKDLPRPVLRIYHPCGVSVLRPNGNQYEIDLPVSGARRNLVITILSSRGGRLVRHVKQ